MKSTDISDKKIFYGLVILIALTILLIVGITFIQRPQTTTSDAQVPGLNNGVVVVEVTEAPENAVPTSIPLPKVDDLEDLEELENLDELEGQGGQDNLENLDELDEGGSDEMTTENSENTTESTTTANETTSQTAQSSEEDTTAEATENNSTANESPDDESTILADSGTPNQNAVDNGALSDTSMSDGTNVGGPNGTTTTSTPVPTAVQQLPTTGTVHITLLIFAVSLLLVVLGLAL